MGAGHGTGRALDSGRTRPRSRRPSPAIHSGRGAEVALSPPRSPELTASRVISRPPWSGNAEPDRQGPGRPILAPIGFALATSSRTARHDQVIVSPRVGQVLRLS